MTFQLRPQLQNIYTRMRIKFTLMIQQKRLDYHDFEGIDTPCSLRSFSINRERGMQ
jgi:hypothetical protein